MVATLQTTLSALFAEKAPAGYGLGTIAYNAVWLSDANDGWQNGWYRLAADATNGTGFLAVVRVDAYSADMAVQYAYSSKYSTKYGVTMKRCLVEGVWGEWEWIDPPLALGIEYRTTKRYLEKAVYMKAVSFGSLPATTTKTVVFSSTAVTAAITLKMVLSNGCALNSGYNKTRNFSGTYGIWLDNTLQNIRVVTEADFSSLTGIAIIEYIKD